MPFKPKPVCKNLFLIAYLCWGSRSSLREEDQENKFGGTVGYGKW